MTDPTDTPEPTAEEWRIAQEIDLRYPTTDAYAHTLARYRTRLVQRAERVVEAAREARRLLAERDYAPAHYAALASFTLDAALADYDQEQSGGE